MLLRSEKIIRVRVIGSNDCRKTVISALHDVGVMQLEELSGEAAEMLQKRVTAENVEFLNRELLRFRGMEAVLPHRRVGERKYFASTRELLEAAANVKADNEIKTLRERETALNAALRELENRLQIVQKMSGLDYDLSVFRSAHISSFIASGGEDIKGTVKGAIEDAVVKDIGDACLVAIRADREAELARLANEKGMSLVAVPEMNGTPSEFGERTRLEAEALRAELETVSKRLSDIADIHFPAIAQIREQLDIESKKYDVSEKLAGTTDAFALEGWIPSRYFGMLGEMLDNLTSGSVILSRVKTNEEPPTLFRNPRGVKLFEFFIRFYSLPREYEIEPTLVFAFVFPLFFGLMVGDWGYGLAILLISLFIIHRLDHPVAHSHIPKFLSRFVLMIMGPNALRTLAKALIPSSLVAIAVGALFNEFFGFQVLPFTVFAVEPGLAKLLLISGYIGLLLVSFGLILGAINEYTVGHRKGIAGKAGWLAFAWGIAVFGLNLLHRVPMNFANPGVSVPVALIIGGVATVLAVEGTMGAMEIPSIISHILSYTRIVGILLASVILASVINIALSAFASDPLLIPVGIFIVIVGQVFNLIIAVFESGIQGARLLYVEFFSKFYKGNGRYFRPFSSPRNYTIKQFDMDMKGGK